ncbi:NrsF family protein [Rhizobium sp. MC63]|uniref:NrsF family protein n=1 Tax=Rhizobium mulingense TaxID=3031128 RepID=A0ACC6N1T6_9HYPH|nr:MULTISPECIES: NrsF family protein [unclassified Rhizobium]MDF0699321.1 NrsF family protein [Rhizobium sp. MC63]MEA3519639.1 NrsF family protein [Rhizobium sp. MJ31]
MTETDDIIEHLAEDLKPVPRNALRRRFTLGIVPAMGFSLLLMLIILGLRIDMPDVLMLPVFWIKSAYNALVAVAAFIAVYRLSRPDGSEGGFFGLLALIFAAMAVVAAIQLLMAPVGTYRLLILGSSALHCPLLIVGFAIPIYAGTVWALRRAAPVDLRLTGFIAGIAAGAAGAWVYSWFCTENGMPFVLIWYTFGILITGALGAVAGPRLLRW